VPLWYTEKLNIDRCKFDLFLVLMLFYLGVHLKIIPIINYKKQE